jgi:hypothetical protein
MMPQAIFSKAMDQACEDDRLWFDAHPDHKLRLRRAVPREFNGHDMPPTPDWIAAVLVILIGPGLRLRQPFALPATFVEVLD